MVNVLPSVGQRYTISVKLGNVENPFTKLFVRLVGDKGESSKIVLRPAGSQLEKFEDGKVYKFTVEMPGVGQVINFVNKKKAQCSRRASVVKSKWEKSLKR